MKKYHLYVIILMMIVTIFLGGCQEKQAPIEEKPPVLETRKEITEGDFIYRLVSEKEVYVKNGPVKIYAELEYIGEKEKIDIYHAASPFYFPMLEKTRDYAIDYPMNEPLLTTTLMKGKPLREDYRGAGGYSQEDEKDYIRFIQSITKNQFPKGDYVVEGFADFFVSNQEKPDENIAYTIKAQIEFQVK